MSRSFIENPPNNNNLLINAFRVYILAVCMILFGGKWLNIIFFSQLKHYFELLLIALLSLITEIIFFISCKKSKYINSFKFYLVFVVFLASFYLNYATQNPYMIALLLYPLIASAFLYDGKLITMVTVLDVLSVLTLNFSFPDKYYHNDGLFVQLHIFILGVFFILYSIRSKKIIEASIMRENELVQTVQELKQVEKDLNDKFLELQAYNQQLASTNECFEQSYSDLVIKQQEVITLNQVLSSSIAKTEKAYIELNEKQQEMEAFNEELTASNDSLEEACNELILKNQEIIALNHVLSSSNEKLDKAYNEVNTKQQEMEALNEELIASNISLEQAYNELRQAEIQLVQQEKMASLGQLSAGIAHEINTPMGAINCNMDVSKKIISLINSELLNLESQKPKQLLQKLDELNEINIMACKRITNIVKSLKSFARLDDQDVFQQINIHDDIDNTLILLNNRLKNNVEVLKEYGELPRIKCYASQLNQVFMNLLVNAVEAIPESGKIWIKTHADNNNIVYISIKDNGIGIKSEYLEKIFSPGFTTKGVGVGTGLGLAITYDIIKRHGGTILVYSEYGKGAEFIVELPIQ